MRPTAVLLLAALLLAAGRPTPTPQPMTTAQAVVQLRGIVQRGLALVPRNFAGGYGPATRSSDEARHYRVAGSLATHCATCEVIDEYAIGTNVRERWVYEFDYYGHKGWKRGRMIEFVESALGPLMRSFDLQTGSTDDGETYLDWRSNDTFVYVETFSGKDATGVEVRIGHYLKKNAHVVKFSSPLSSDEKTQLKNDVKNVLALGLANAPTDFTTLRGKSYASESFAANVSFGETVGGCTISETPPTSGANGAGYWELTCQTAALGGDQKELLELLRSTIWDALPGSYKTSADADKGAADYRWEDGTAQITVSLAQRTYDDYRDDYEISIRHWLPSR